MSTPDEVVAERLQPVINAVAERIHYAESRRANYASMGGALIAAGIAIFTFGWGTIDEPILKWAATFGSGVMILAGGAVLFTYGTQTNRYPYTNATTTWKWFYRDAIPTQSKFDLPKWSYYTNIGWNKKKENVSKLYREALPEFKSNISKLSIGKTNSDQDIEQLFSLHLNEKYKNIFLSDIRTLFNRGLVAIVLATAAGGIVGYILQERAAELRHYHQKQDAYVLDSWVKLLTPTLQKEAQVSVKVQVLNTTARPLHIASIRPLDAKGWPLPLEVAMVRPTQDIAPRGSAIYYATAKGNLAVMDRVRGFSIETQ